ncbi:hypothetical protein C8039_15840 [Halogeometricum sp. wsp3]|nr:hypothetical protein C8039_15840 [Halogeometricum sp. wsp3]
MTGTDKKGTFASIVDDATTAYEATADDETALCPIEYGLVSRHTQAASYGVAAANLRRLPGRY